jgi:predicted small metal-binding protein
MARKYVDCRKMPSQCKCTVAGSAGSENELIEVAVQHAVRLTAIRTQRSSGKSRSELLRNGVRLLSSCVSRHLSY